MKLTRELAEAIADSKAPIVVLEELPDSREIRIDVCVRINPGTIKNLGHLVVSHDFLRDSLVMYMAVKQHLDDLVTEWEEQ